MSKDKKKEEYSSMDDALGELLGETREGSKPLTMKVTGSGAPEVVEEDDHDEDEGLDEDETVTFETETAKMARLELEAKAKADAEKMSDEARAEAEIKRLQAEADKADAAAEAARVAIQKDVETKAKSKKTRTRTEAKADDLEAARLEAVARTAEAQADLARLAVQSRKDELEAAKEIAQQEAGAKKAAADAAMEIARLESEARTAEAQAEVARLALRKEAEAKASETSRSKAEAKAKALDVARLEAVTKTTEAQAEIARLTLKAKMAETDAAMEIARIDGDAKKVEAESAKEIARLEAEVKTAEAQASTAYTALQTKMADAVIEAKKAQTEADVKAKADAVISNEKARVDARAKADADADAEAVRIVLFTKIDKLVMAIESKATDGSFDIMAMPFDERMARTRALHDELKPLLAQADKLTDLSPTEAALLKDAHTDAKALELLIKKSKSLAESLQPTMLSTPPPMSSHGAGEGIMPPPGAMNPVIPDTRKSGSPPPLPSAATPAETQSESEYKLGDETQSRVRQMPRVSEPSIIVEMGAEEVEEEEMIEPLLPTMRVGRVARPEVGYVNDYVIDNPSVSQRHAVLTLLSDGKLLVEDLKSTNGTYLVTNNGPVRIEGAVGTTVEVGSHLRFGSVDVTIKKNPSDGKIYLHIAEIQPTGHTEGFMARSEEEARMHREEQAALDEVEEVVDSAETSMRRQLRSPTEIQREIESGGAPKRKWGAIIGGLLAAAAVLVIIGFSGMWVADHLPTGPEVAETDTTEPTPTETPTEVPTETVPETHAVSYNCHGVTDEATCHTVAPFLLTRADGQPYWDCGMLNPDEARGMFRVEDPRATAGHRRILADTCGCQLCEPL